MIIRKEIETDYTLVFDLIEKAFAHEANSDHQEQFLVQRLRMSPSFVPELSLIAELEKKIVGHILLTKIQIKKQETSFPSLALAPVSVLPSFQGKGIGAALIHEAHRIAKKLGFKSVILLGHEKYYPRFGYQKASSFGIQLPFPVPDENCMAIELTEKALSGVSGIVEYDPAFYLNY